MSTEPAAGPFRVPLIGQVLSGRYRILAKLGEGAMAAVYLAEHTGVGKTIVLKVLLPDLASQPEFVEGFLREARIAAEIHDDNVIDIFYSGRSPEGYVFLAMEHVDGPTLFTLLAEQGPLPWARAQPLLLQIAGALAAAHAQGVVHRDVKPENVLVGRRKRSDGEDIEYVKVVDFGIANARGDASATGAESVAGTPEFMSPEQAQGRTPDPRDDVYGFGCLMYQVLTGDVPFREDDMARLLLMHLRDPVQPPRERRPDLEIPTGAQDIVMRALAKTRDERWPDMAEVRRELAAVDAPAAPAETPAAPAEVALSPSIAPRFRAPEPEAPKPARPNLRLPKDKPRSKTPLLVGAGVVLLAVGFAFLRYMLLHAPGRLEIVTAPPEAEIYVDGQKMSERSPMFLDASPGPYNVVVRSPGYETLTTVLVITPRGNERVPINLVPLPAPPKTDAPPHHVSSEPHRHKAPAPAPISGVTFIDFKKAAAAQHAR